MKYSRHYALKYSFIFLTSFFLVQNSVASTGSAEVDPHVLIKEMVTTIVGSTNAKSAQETLCKEGGVFRRSVKVKGKILPVVAHNCGSYDFFNYAMLMCSDYPGFSGSTCFKKGTEVFKKRGETPDLEKAKQYIEKAIREKKVDPHTLACSTPPEKLMGAFKEVAARGCAPETKPATKPQTGWQVTKPSAAAGAKITIGSHKLNPPVTIVRSSLKDLPPRESLEIDHLDMSQSALQSVLRDLSLQSAGKTGPVKGSMVQQEQSLVTQYESVNSTLSSLKIEIDGGKKSLRTDLLATAQKLNADTKKLLETLAPETKGPAAKTDTKKFLDALKGQPKAAAAA
jgi:hypothetical protein